MEFIPSRFLSIFRSSPVPCPSDLYVLALALALSLLSLLVFFACKSASISVPAFLHFVQLLLGECMVSHSFLGGVDNSCLQAFRVDQHGIILVDQIIPGSMYPYPFLVKPPSILEIVYFRKDSWFTFKTFIRTCVLYVHCLNLLPLVLS